MSGRLPRTTLGEFLRTHPVGDLLGAFAICAIGATVGIHGADHSGVAAASYHASAMSDEYSAGQAGNQSEGLKPREHKARAMGDAKEASRLNSMWAAALQAQSSDDIAAFAAEESTATELEDRFNYGVVAGLGLVSSLSLIAAAGTIAYDRRRNS